MQRSDQDESSQICLSLGAGKEQLPAISLAQAQGFRVLALDGDAKAPGLEIADLSEVVDLRDVDAVVRCARAHGVTFTLAAPIGRLLTTLSAVHEALGLRGVTPESACVCTDKHQFHARMRQAGIGVPQQLVLPTVRTLCELETRNLRFPLVIKPRCGSGSRGVRAVASIQDWPSAVRDALADPPAEGWVLETYIDGMVLGVDGAVVNGRSQIVLVRDKRMSPLPHRVELAYRAPALLSVSAMCELQTMLSVAWSALGVRNCLYHADVILQPQGRPVLIEMSARPSGLGIAADFVPACTGVDFLSQGLRLHRAEEVNFVPQRAQPTLLHHWHHSGGYVKRVPSAPELLKLPHVLGAEVGWSIGQYVKWPTNVGELLEGGHLLVSAQSWDEVESTLSHALSLFEVTPYDLP
jgi:biotin carboxylase